MECNIIVYEMETFIVKLKNQLKAASLKSKSSAHCFSSSQNEFDKDLILKLALEYVYSRDCSSVSIKTENRKLKRRD